MFLSVKLPPRRERDVLVEAFANGVRNNDGFEELRFHMGRLIEQGHSYEGIVCMMMHMATFKLIRLKLNGFGDKTNIDALLSHPISLN